ncbi:DUF5615 family PIN-like protein [Nocardioides sp. NPDC059952]|uniref:DUF5615 family PIN-like protein n=1 Tax=Nocardioides sp. NPDC059952 TaxID=3347014 RepID=UPI00365E2B3E
MRLLLDENLSEKLIPLLITAGHDVTHVRHLGLAGTLDPDVLELAVRDERILVSADTDFGTLLARSHATSPSFVLIRRLVGRRVQEIASVIIDNLGDVEEDLLAGAIVVIGDETMRIKRLPIG